MQNRKPNRLEGYDYSARGAYFVTMCVKDRRRLLSDIVGADDPGGPIVRLSYGGEIVERNLQIMREIYAICGEDGAPRSSPPTNTLSIFITALKKFTNKAYGENIWQRSFHDHIIRDQKDYNARWQYIDENPKKWIMGKDEYYA